jgi:hypothetical protein
MTEVETYSKQINASFSDRADDHFFVFTTFSPTNDPKDVENGAFSIRVTNCLQFWRSKESITAEELSKSAGHGRMKPALEALTEKFTTTQKYTYSIDSRDEDLFLSIFFTLKEGGARFRLRVQLFPVDDAKAAVAKTLETLIVNLDRLKVATNKLRSSKYALETEVAAISALKQDFASNNHEKEVAERKIYQGLAALLNTKKKQLRAAAGKEEDGHAMDVEGREAMEVEESEMGEAASVAGAEESESEDETELSEERSKEPESPDRYYDDDWSGIE